MPRRLAAPVTPAAEPGAVPLDLLAALRASIEAAKQRRSAGNGGRRRVGASTEAAKKKAKKGYSPGGKSARRRNAGDVYLTRVRDTPTELPSSDNCKLVPTRHEQLSGLRPRRRPLPRRTGHVRTDHTVECTDAACELADLLRHLFIVDCIDVLGRLLRGQRGSGAGGGV